ncbi:hypothetical protein, partial [Steroidobacter sp.]|uniref:hypothetical protein n=1 Tax=Steroidobacter sp. TaxID=1978227 RepID=UPI001A484052
MSVRNFLEVLLGGCLVAVSAAQAETSVGWPLHGNDANESRHSTLSAIDGRNVHQLGLAWAFEDFIVRGRTHRGMQ